MRPRAAKRLLENETVLILEDHGADRAHTVSRYLLNETPCRFSYSTRRASDTSG